MATSFRATTPEAPAGDKPPRDAARRSRVVWSDVRRAVREAHGTNLVHAVKVRRDGAIDLVLKRDDLPSAKTKEPQSNATAAQQAAPTRKQKRMARKDDFHARKRAEAAAALGLPAPGALLPPPPPPAPLTSPSAPSPGGSDVTVGERADKRDAALVGADKTPTKLNEETDEAGIASRVDERSSSERKKTRGAPLFSNATGRSYSR